MTKLHQQDFARNLRTNQTSAESKLWGYLRKRSLSGYRFHRQVTIGPYTVDFLCREKMLVVEVDGATHGDAHDVRYDQKRTQFLESRSFYVCRVSNLDVYANILGVLDGLLLALAERKSRFKKRPPQSLRDSSPSEAEGA
jgi:very-short-patch-repair endonuclease